MGAITLKIQPVEKRHKQINEDCEDEDDTNDDYNHNNHNDSANNTKIMIINKLNKK